MSHDPKKARKNAPKLAGNCGISRATRVFICARWINSYWDKTARQKKPHARTPTLLVHSLGLYQGVTVEYSVMHERTSTVVCVGNRAAWHRANSQYKYYAQAGQFRANTGVFFTTFCRVPQLLPRSTSAGHGYRKWTQSSARVEHCSARRHVRTGLA